MPFQVRIKDYAVSGALIAVAILALRLPASAAPISPGNAPKDYMVDYLLSDGSIPTEHQDLEFRNGWGIAASPTSPWWVAVNESEVSKIYNADGAVQDLRVVTPGAPTGIVSNEGAGFMVTDGTTSAPAKFLFAMENGQIAGWNPGVGPAPPDGQAFVVADRSSVGASYKGLAIAQTIAGGRLYAADFHNARVDVFDENFALVNTIGGFANPRLPSGMAPFGIQTLNGRIFVAYAKQLNAPWGMAIAPVGFGAASGKLLVGNFGDGTIAVFNMTDDMLRFSPSGVLRDALSHKPIQIDGLWGIGFGNDGAAGSSKALYFAAGPADETHGAFGRITFAATP
jgi:hypothetical protein